MIKKLIGWYFMLTGIIGVGGGLVVAAMGSVGAGIAVVVVAGIFFWIGRKIRDTAPDRYNARQMRD